MVRTTVFLLAFALTASCTDANVVRTQAKVVPVTVGETVRLDARDLALAMIRAGFTREDILEKGPTIRNAIATHGGAEVRDGSRVTAIFSVFDNDLYVVSQTSGTYVQELSET